jgi:Lon-like protease
MRRLVAILGVIVILAALVFVPLPLVALSPGIAIEVEENLEIGTEVEPLDGEFLLMTVRVGQPSALGALAAIFDDRVDLVPSRAVIPEGVDPDVFREEQQRLFQESAELAAAVGLRAAGFDAVVDGDGAEVIGVVEEAPAEGRLRLGDVVIEAGGEPVSLAADLVTRVGELRAGDVVELAVRRNGQIVPVTVEIDEVGQLGRPGLGVALRTANRTIELPFEVEIRESQVGGPSGGLLMALTVYDLLTEEDLAGGRSVAGTGSIAVGGRVGSVGGVTQKVATAIEVGADIFLVPEAEVDEARSAAGERLQVIPVATFDEAVAALR